MVRHPEVVVAEIGDPFSTRQFESSIIGRGLMTVIEPRFSQRKRASRNDATTSAESSVQPSPITSNSKLTKVWDCAEKRVTQDAAPIVGGDDDADEAHRRPFAFSGRVNLEAVGNDVVVYRQPINVGIFVIVSAGRHADKQRILRAEVLMGVINAGPRRSAMTAPNSRRRPATSLV